jgi:hypothetical protein
MTHARPANGPAARRLQTPPPVGALAGSANGITAVGVPNVIGRGEDSNG